MAKFTNNEVAIQEEYFKRYETDPNEISKNHGKTFYNLFDLDFDNQDSDIPHFDRINSKESFGTITNKLKFLPTKVQQLLKLKDKTVLDFGCGLGEFVYDVVHKYDAKKAYGVDIASVEKGLTDKYKSDRCIFMPAGATNLDLDDNSVNIISAFLSLEHVFEEDIDTLLAEFNRVCTDGYIFQISHGSSNKKNLRKTTHNVSWWYSKFEPFLDNAYLYHFPKDNYKWGLPPKSGLTRWVCTLKDVK